MKSSTRFDMQKISGVMIAFNEEKNIAECLSGLKFCDEIIVVDSESIDRTTETARRMGAKVYTHAFSNFSDQKNFGIGQATGEWVFLIDADERVSEALGEEIKRTVSDARFEAYEVLRKNRIFGRWMAHGINARDYQLRLIKKNKAVFQGLVHERIHPGEKAGKLTNPLAHHSTPTMASYMNKLNAYTEFESQILKNRNEKISIQQLKCRPLAVFIRTALLKGGILDGKEGLFFAIMSAYYDFVNRAKHWERSR